MRTYLKHLRQETLFRCRRSKYHKQTVKYLVVYKTVLYLPLFIHLNVI